MQGNIRSPPRSQKILYLPEFKGNVSTHNPSHQTEQLNQDGIAIDTCRAIDDNADGLYPLATLRVRHGQYLTHFL